MIALHAAPLLEPGDAGSIAIAGSHAALFRGRPDGLIEPSVYAIVFGDAGVGLDGAGIARLPTPDQRGIASAARTAPIGDSRSIHLNGIASFLNQTALARGGRLSMPVTDLVDVLIAARERGA